MRGREGRRRRRRRSCFRPFRSLSDSSSSHPSCSPLTTPTASSRCPQVRDNEDSCCELKLVKCEMSVSYVPLCPLAGTSKGGGQRCRGQGRHGCLCRERPHLHPLHLRHAKLLTNIWNPIQAGQELLRRGTCTKWVVIKMGSKESIMITESAVSCAPYFKIRVVDTVGCRDSFTAARAFGLLHNFPAINTLALTNAVGAATTTGCGAGRNATHLDKVLNLLKESDFNEEGKTWTELVEGCSICPEVSVPSKTPINGSSDLFVNVVPVSGVVSDLLLMLEV